MNRRGFLASMMALGVAPAIVRAESIMRVRPVITPYGIGDVIAPTIAGDVTEFMAGDIVKWAGAEFSGPAGMYVVTAVTRSGFEVSNLTGLLPESITVPRGSPLLRPNKLLQGLMLRLDP